MNLLVIYLIGCAVAFINMHIIKAYEYHKREYVENFGEREITIFTLLSYITIALVILYWFLELSNIINKD